MLSLCTYMESTETWAMRIHGSRLRIITILLFGLHQILNKNMYSTCEGCFPAAHGHFSLGQVDKNIDGYVSSPLLSALNPGAHPTLPALPHDCSPHCRVCCVQARTAVVQQAPLSSAIWHYYVTNRTVGEITKIYQASLVPSCVHWCGVNTESGRWGEAKMEVQYQSGAEKV